jgi:hypothetical protein
MNSVSSLQMERDSILNRMQARRAGYRHMLQDGTDDIPEVHEVGDTHVYTYEQAPAERHANPVLQVIKEHPLLCALGVAAVFAIGPKRIGRTVMSGAALAGTLSARNNSNVDMLGRLLTMAGAYAQGRSQK